MAQTVRSFLAQQNNIGKHDELQAALTCLPGNTPLFPYEDVDRMQAEYMALDPNINSLCVFANVPTSVVVNELQEVKLGIKTYYSRSKILVEIPSISHEVTAASFEQLLCLKLQPMGMNMPMEELYFMRHTTVHHKEAGSSFRPMRLSPGRPSEWPSVTLEVGVAEAAAALHRDAELWFQRSNGLVQAVITVEIGRNKITVTRYLSREKLVPAQTVVMGRVNGKSPVTEIVNGPFILPFRELFLRDPVQPEGDVMFEADSLRLWANKIWTGFGSPLE